MDDGIEKYLVRDPITHAPCFTGREPHRSFTFMDSRNAICYEVASLAGATHGEFFTIFGLVERHYDASIWTRIPLLRKSLDEVMRKHEEVVSHEIDTWRRREGQSNEVVEMYLKHFLPFSYGVGSQTADVEQDTGKYYKPILAGNIVRYTTNGRNVHSVMMNNASDATSFYNIAERTLVQHYMDKRMHVPGQKSDDPNVVLAAKVDDVIHAPVTIIVYSNDWVHLENCLPGSNRDFHFNGGLAQALDATRRALMGIPTRQFGHGEIAEEIISAK